MSVFVLFWSLLFDTIIVINVQILILFLGGDGFDFSFEKVIYSNHVYFDSKEELLPGGHGLMVRGYRPVINTLAKGLDIRLGHR